MAVTLLGGPETSIQNVDNNVREMDANVYELEPSLAPLVFLADMMGSVEAANPKVEWNEDESMPRITTISASATSAATAFAVVADIFRVGDVIRFSSLGFGLLVTVTAANAISGTVLGTPVSAASGAEIYLVANANAEGATNPSQESSMVAAFPAAQPVALSATVVGADVPRLSPAAVMMER